MPPTFSIILTTYDGAETIARAINSVVKQTYADWELIITDDASSDETVEICQRYSNSDSSIRVIESDINRGVATNMNQAVAKAEGEYLAFLEQDDQWTSNKLQEHIECHQKSNADIVYGNIKYERQKESYIIKTPVPKQVGKPLAVQMFMLGNFIRSFSNVTISQGAWDEVGGLNKRYQIGADFDLFIRLAESNTFSQIDKTLVIKHMDGNNLSESKPYLTYVENRRILKNMSDTYKFSFNERRELSGALTTATAYQAFINRDKTGSVIFGLISCFTKPSKRGFVYLFFAVFSLIPYIGQKIYYIEERITHWLRDDSIRLE